MGLSPIMLLCLIGVSSIVGTEKMLPTFAGPFRAVVKKFINESDDFVTSAKAWAKIYVTPYKPQQPQYMWGLSKNTIEINDQLQVEVRMSTWSNNQWKKNAFVMNFDRACSAFQRHARCLALVFFGDAGQKCPIKPGFRKVVNKTVDLIFPGFPVFQYGHWLFTLLLKSQGEYVAVFVADAETVPRF